MEILSGILIVSLKVLWVIGLVVLDWIIFAYIHHVMHHIYAAHNGFSISKPYIWPVVVATSAYQSEGRAKMGSYFWQHSIHHRHTDHDIHGEQLDPHSPSHERGGFWRLMFQTIRRVQRFDWQPDRDLIERLKKEVQKKEWYRADEFAHGHTFRFVTFLLFAWGFYHILPEGGQWFVWLYMPIRLFYLAIQGTFVNYFGHEKVDPEKANATKQGELARDFGGQGIKRAVVRFFLMWENEHGFHHKFPMAVNYGQAVGKKDLAYRSLLFFQKLGIIKLKPNHDKQPKIAA